jgi:pimeloyl-ACP methyl ester carboxylesterase
MLASAPKGDGRAVMLLPGLVNSDRSMALMRRYLNRLGYRAVGWGLGRNLGARAIGAEGEKLLAQVAKMHERTGEKVTLVGVSLGGIMARFVAHRMPDAVREVITVASPYAGDPRATRVWRQFQWLTGESLDNADVVARRREIAKPLPVPATAIWSRSDGLVNGLICRAPDEPGLRCIEVRSSHIGVQVRPEVLRAVANVLGDTGTPPERSSG